MENSYSWFGKAKFGLFLHWGIYSLLGRGEQVLPRERLNPRDYEKLADEFNPADWAADDWMEQASSAGMNYAVLTSKHMDGFCMFDSKLTDYTSSKRGPKRDIVGEYVESCRKYGMRVGLYYSLADCHHPACYAGPERDPEGWKKFIEFTHNQVRELCSNYGQIDILWFDAGWPWTAVDWRSEELDDMIRSLQPHVMINDRLHGGGSAHVQSVGDYSLRTDGYFDTAEQSNPNRGPRPMEACNTAGKLWWGYLAGERMYKNSNEVMYLLTQAADAGSNFLFNIGPKPDGSFPVEFSNVLRDLAPWMKINGESIYDTNGSVLELATLGHMTRRGSTAYLHIIYWPGKDFSVYGLGNKIHSATYLCNGKPARFVQDGSNLRFLDVPEQSPDSLNTVIKLELDGEPFEFPGVVRLWQQNVSTQSLADWLKG